MTRSARSSSVLTEHTVALEDVEASRQASKVLKCVAFTNMQVSDMMHRKHERLEHRIKAVCEEIDHLMADLAENAVNQRERQQQLFDIEEDVEKAQLLGNSCLVKELEEERQVLETECKREKRLYAALQKAVRSRNAVKKQFLVELTHVDDEMMSFNKKQQFIQLMLSTFTRQSFYSHSQSSSDSQSECGESDDEEGGDQYGEEQTEPRNRRPSDVGQSIYRGATLDSDKQHLHSPPMRVRRWSSVLEPPQTHFGLHQDTQNRARSASDCATPPTDSKEIMQSPEIAAGNIPEADGA